MHEPGCLSQAISTTSRGSCRGRRRPAQQSTTPQHVPGAATLLCARHETFRDSLGCKNGAVGQSTIGPGSRREWASTVCPWPLLRSDDHLSRVWALGAGDDDERVSLLLPVCRMRRDAYAAAGGLLCVLLVRRPPMSPEADALGKASRVAQRKRPTRQHRSRPRVPGRSGSGAGRRRVSSDNARA